MLDSIAARETEFSRRLASQTAATVPAETGPASAVMPSSKDDQKNDVSGGKSSTEDGSDTGGVAALRAGTSEAFSAIFAAMRGSQNDPQAKIASHTAAAAAELKNVSNAINQTNQLLDGNEVRIVGSFN